MSWLLFALCVLIPSLFVLGVLAIIHYLRFVEQAKRLPDACSYEDLMQRNERLRKDQEELHLDMAKCQEKKEELDVQNKDLCDSNGRLKQDNEALTRTIDEPRNDEQEAVHRNEELRQKTEQTEVCLRNLEGDVSDKQRKRQELSDELQGLQDRIAAENQNISELLREKAVQQGEQESLKGKNDALREENSSLSSANAGLQEQLVGLRDEYAQAKSAAEAMRQERERSEANLEEVRADLERRVQESEEVRDQVRELRGEVSELETRKTTLHKELDILLESIRTVRRDLEAGKPDSSKVLKDLWEPLVFPDLRPSLVDKDELQILEKTRQYIRGKELFFPKRVLYAFHTALKCNDISPLTVLAGISGTGKSALPKCYAEGMGMHFVMLAVQPRWDSPQDLLGFYNYMEQRYKATEFSRALVRFEHHNRKDWGAIPPECDDRSDRMLLVLLDEMNLARVEYYFSEFLSKLEIRRGLNPDDTAERAKAEIELELLGQSPLRLYPDGNVLFTGTMNEDESTQSLSDKVLDRANVLRFGRPTSTDLVDKLKGAPKMEREQEGLRYENWQKWLNEGRSMDGGDVMKWIDELNGAMMELHRPFGYRVAQAMAAYVRNYPGSKLHEQARKNAMADQIEQRILPKLRGVELDDRSQRAMRKLDDLIAKTDDATLWKAFQESRESDEGVFLWRGVDRSGDEE